MRRLALLALLLPAAFLGAQTSEHQRLGVERRDLLEFSPSSSLSLELVDGVEDEELQLSPSLGFELLYARHLSFGLVVPALALLPLARGPSIPARAAIADPSVYLGYTFRLGDWRLSSEFSYRHPLGIWNGYEAREKYLQSSSGYPRLGASLAATRFLDPLALGLRLEAATGLPRRERFGSSRRPLDLELDLSATEALNDLVALSASLANELDLPRLLNGVPAASGTSYELSASLGLLFSLGDSDLRLGLAKSLSVLDEAASFSLSFSHSFRLKGASHE